MKGEMPVAEADEELRGRAAGLARRSSRSIAHARSTRSTRRCGAKLAAAYPRFARDPQIYAVVIQSASEKAFSAGGDVRELVRWGRDDRASARKAFADEYALDWLHECFSKPTISLIDGAVMGSGVGITLYGTHRVAGPKYKFAMPECAIGLFPDVGAAHALARMPDAIGMYLGLTGRTIGPRGRLRAGAPYPLHPARALRGDHGGARRHLAGGHAARRAPRRSGPGRARAIHGSHLALLRGGDGGGDRRASRRDHDRARLGAIGDRRSQGPLAVSLKVTHRHIREAAARDLRQTLMVDYRLACRFLDGHDFFEGVRAALIDKDGKPRWQPAAT